MIEDNAIKEIFQYSKADDLGIEVEDVQKLLQAKYWQLDM
jgi:hypothetical protein